MSLDLSCPMYEWCTFNVGFTTILIPARVARVSVLVETARARAYKRASLLPLQHAMLHKTTMMWHRYSTAALRLLRVRGSHTLNLLCVEWCVHCFMQHYTHARGGFCCRGLYKAHSVEKRVQTASLTDRKTVLLLIPCCMLRRNATSNVHHSCIG